MSVWMLAQMLIPRLFVHEPMRYRVASMKGATTEWSKMEGLTYDFTRNKLYVSMSEMKEGMEDNAKEGVPNPSYDLGGHNDIRLEWNECGCGAHPCFIIIFILSHPIECWNSQLETYLYQPMCSGRTHRS
jgi:hypothetical protein